MVRSDEKPITGMCWLCAAFAGAHDAFAQHRANDDVGAVGEERARGRVGGRFIRAGVARDEQRALIAVVEEREFGGVVERGRILRAERERQQQADADDLAPAHEGRRDAVAGLHLRFGRRVVAGPEAAWAPGQAQARSRKRPLKRQS